MSPKISVIIPVFNTEPYLEKCINSVLEQSLKDIEIIICNDGSTDKSQSIIDKYKNKYNKIITINHKNNKGLSISRNDCMKIAKGEYIVFIDSDDYIAGDMLEELYKKISSVKAEVLFFGYREYSYNNEDFIKDSARISFYPDLISGAKFFCESINMQEYIVVSCGAIYNTNFLKENMLEFKPNIIHEDYLFYYKLLMKAKKVTSVKNCYYNYMRHSNSLSLSKEIYLEKLLSLCDIVHDINEINKSNNVKMQLYTNIYQKMLIRVMINYYKNIKCFCKDITPEQDYILRMISANLYNGFFTYKLPACVVEKIKKYNNIYIYGAGKVGKGLYQLLKEYNIKINNFIVTKNEIVNEIIEGVEVCPIYYIKEKNDSLILIGASKKYAIEIYKNLIKAGFTNIIDMSKYI